VSARHQVKRLDRIFEKSSLFPKIGPAEETSFLRSVRILAVRNFTGFQARPACKPQVKSGPDVFADALVPRAAPMAPGAPISPESKCPFCPPLASGRRRLFCSRGQRRGRPAFATFIIGEGFLGV
jgi:hypothetical protein